MSLISRRSFLENAGAGTLGLTSMLATENSDASLKNSAEGSKNSGPIRLGTVNCVTEWRFESRKTYADPFNEVELDVVFSDPEGKEQRVPAFWSGEQVWRVRYAPRMAGRYTYRSVCSDPANSDLQALSGVCEVAAYIGTNLLLKHGPIHVASDRLHFEHADGTPFFWLGDTWWMGLCKRLRWPEDVQVLAEDRVKKGFTIIQIVAGLYPDMPPFDPRGENEAGYAWEADYARINPRYFDIADLRIQYLIDRGLVPCLVGCWGYFLPIMGAKKIKQHWRNIVARWGAYPVFWCLAGEGGMPYYLSKSFEHLVSGVEDETVANQKRGWTEIGKYVRSIDPYGHPVTIHPMRSARDTVEDQTVLDFDMLQTGHSGVASIPSTLDRVTGDLARTPRMPVLVGEVCYEGIMDSSRQEVVRFMYWASMLSGAAGHTYGANGIWQLNTKEKPYGPSPHGRSWGDTPWETAYLLPGSLQVGLGKQLLCRYDWWRFEPHPEWVEPHWSKETDPASGGNRPSWENSTSYQLPYAAGIPGEVRVVFVMPMWNPPVIKKLESGVIYKAFFFDPRSGKEYPIGEAAPDAAGDWHLPLLPTMEEWVIVLEKKRAAG